MAKAKIVGYKVVYFYEGETEDGGYSIGSETGVIGLEEAIAVLQKWGLGYCLRPVGEEEVEHEKRMDSLHGAPLNRVAAS